MKLFIKSNRINKLKNIIKVTEPVVNISLENSLRYIAVYFKIIKLLYGINYKLLFFLNYPYLKWSFSNQSKFIKIKKLFSCYKYTNEYLDIFTIIYDIYTQLVKNMKILKKLEKEFNKIITDKNVNKEIKNEKMSLLIKNTLIFYLDTKETDINIDELNNLFYEQKQIIFFVLILKIKQRYIFTIKFLTNIYNNLQNIYYKLLIGKDFLQMKHELINAYTILLIFQNRLLTNVEEIDFLNVHNSFTNYIHQNFIVSIKEIDRLNKWTQFKELIHPDQIKILKKMNILNKEETMSLFTTIPQQIFNFCWNLMKIEEINIFQIIDFIIYHTFYNLSNNSVDEILGESIMILINTIEKLKKKNHN